MKLGTIIGLFILPVNAIPDSVNWSKYCPPVKDQGRCALSYVYDSLIAIECAYSIKNETSIILSSQEIIDCTKSYGNNGCVDGSIESTYTYIMENDISLNAEYAYTGVSGSCKIALNKDKFKITGYKEILAGNEQALMEAIATQGPVAAKIYVT